MTTVTRCKARVLKKEEYDLDSPTGGYQITLGAPPYDPNPESENGRFFAATPYINMTLGVLNPGGAAVFEEGKDYYVDFIPVEE